MCGICGLIAPDLEQEVSLHTVRAMMQRLEHRGPDGGGYWQHGGTTLGHRRLAVIDLEGGHQPLHNETGDVGVVFNGEIYNYRDLRHLLAQRGHVFRTASDTEVLVHGYEEWGDSFVEKLRGMFALAIYDTRNQQERVLLVRDRLGVKPLYYWQSGVRVAFASEIKALFAVPGVHRSINSSRLGEYLTFRSVVGRETLFSGILELEPGTLLVLEGGRSKCQRYWSPQQPTRHHSTSESLVEPGRSFIEEAVSVRLVSDRSLGTITSGGLDSSLVSAIAAELAGAGIDTFCVGFEDQNYDERPYARVVADQIGSFHHDIEVSPQHISEELDRLTWAHDEPLSHPNSIPMHLIFRYAKEVTGVTVLLSGEGADEVFGGYEWYSIALRRAQLQRVPGIAALAAHLPFGKLATLARVMGQDYLQFANALTPPASVSRLMADPAQLHPGRSELLADDSPDALFAYDQRTYLLPLLQRQDRMSMAAGLEARVPFLDHPLVEWANQLSARSKLPGGRRKGLLKDISGKWLPESIINRKKVGFAMPLGDWMRQGGPLGQRIQSLLDNSSLAVETLGSTTVERLIREHDQRSTDNTDLLWSLVALDSWSKTFLRGSENAVELPGSKTGLNLADAAIHSDPGDWKG